eukprot:19471_1
MLLSAVKCIVMTIISFQIASCSILPWDWDSIEWNNNLRSLAIFVTSNINIDGIPIGEVISNILSIVWPEESEDNDIWSEMEATMEAIVNKAILQEKLDSFQGRIMDIQDAMNNYNASISVNDTVNGNKHLGEALDHCDDLKNQVNTSITNDDYLQLFSIMVPLSALHLTNLREQYIFGSKFNGGITDPTWKTDLNESYYYYKDWFEWYYPSWYQMRSDSIKASWDANSFTTTDTLSGVVCHYNSKESIHNWNNAQFAQSIAEGSKVAMLNEARSYMFALVESTFYIHKYVPWLANTSSIIIPNFAKEVITIGPYAYWTGNDNFDQLCGDTAGSKFLKADTPGIIQAVTGSYWNSFDKLQLIYTTHDGKYVGDTGGTPFSWSVNHEKHYISSFWVKWGNPEAMPGIITAISVGYSNYTISGPVGNKGGWKGPETNVTIGNNWQLISIAQQPASGPSGTQGTALIYFNFTHYTLVDTVVTALNPMKSARKVNRVLIIAVAAIVLVSVVICIITMYIFKKYKKRRYDRIENNNEIDGEENDELL